MDRGNPGNRGKWQAWTDVGYTIDTPEQRAAATQDVSSQLAAGLPDASAELTRRDAYGTYFEVQTEIVGPNGRTGTLVTIWQYPKGSDRPRLVSNWLKAHR